MAKYSKKTQDEVEHKMHEMKEGKLKSGPGGKGGKVTNPKQAVAIALSESREKGYKTPKKTSSAGKSGGKKTSSRTKSR